jgi:AhpD family alkylhydroperoxidase
MSTVPRLPPPRFDGPPPADPAQRGVLAHQPELLRAFMRLYGTLWSHGVVDQATKEVARLRNARVTGCNYCRNVRFDGARQAGLSEDLAAQIDDGFADSELTDAHKAVIRYADVFLSDPAGLTPALRAEMLRHFSPAQIVELTAGLALFMGFSKIAVVLGQEPVSMPVTVIPTPTRPRL